MSWTKSEEINCPICGELAMLIKVFPEEMYDPPYEEYITCPNCGIFGGDDYEERDD